MPDNQNPEIRQITVSDAAQLRSLANVCQPLLVNGVYVNLFLAKYFGNTCFLLELSNRAIGFVSGLRSSVEPEVFFLWQLGLVPEHRGKGYSQILIEAVINGAKKIGCRRIQYSISPGNEQSLRAFSKFVKHHSLRMSVIDEEKYKDPLSDKQGHEVFYEIRL